MYLCTTFEQRFAILICVKMLNAIIDDFVALYESNAKQRSDEWYQLIKSTVGGSDMGVIAGVEPV